MNFNLFAVLLLKVSRATKLLPVLLLLLPVVVQAQNAYSTNADGSVYTYSTNADGTANIVAYAGSPWVVTIPTNINGLTVTSIGVFAFKGGSLTSVTIPGSVTSIGEQAFFQCYSLTSVTIDNGVTSIGVSAFVYCHRLTNITIPASVTNIEGGAFENCTNLTAITVDINSPAYSSLNGVLFDKSQTTLIEYPGGLGGSYTIPDSVTSIGRQSFQHCTRLTNVTIGSAVTNIGDLAFPGCTNLTNVTIPGSVTYIGESAFQDTGLTSVTIPGSVTSIGVSAFLNCARLTNATIGSGVTTIGDEVFATCTRLTSVTIPDSVNSIGEDAFYASGLTNVTIENGVTSIGAGAFGQTPLTKITIPGSVTSIWANAFFSCYSLTSVYFTGNTPSPTNDSTVFSGDPATVYYLPGTTGWGAMFDGRPTALGSFRTR